MRKVQWLLRADHEAAPNDLQRWAIGYEAERLAAAALDLVEILEPILNDQDDDVDDLLALQLQAAGIAKRLRGRLLAAKLGRVEGRTPEEAEAYLAKARELRS